jgi:hypothetical protein
MTMTATLFPSLFSPFTRRVADLCADLPVERDVTDPAEYPDMMGTVCRLHGCARYLDEAPLVPSSGLNVPTSGPKPRFFPNSWTAIASYSAQPRRLGRGVLSRRERLVVIRYCPECREAARQWLEVE